MAVLLERKSREDADGLEGETRCVREMNRERWSEDFDRERGWDEIESVEDTG